MSSIHWIILSLVWLLVGGIVWAQQTAYRLPQVYAIRNARIVPVSSKVIEKGTLVIRDGVITAVGTADQVKIPADAHVLDGEKLTVYPGFIDAYSTIGLPAAGDDPVYTASNRGNGHPNARIRPERRAVDLFQPDSSAFSARRKAGFTTAVIAPPLGIMTGQSTLISLGDGSATDLVISPVVASHLTFRARGFSGGGAPGQAPTLGDFGYPSSMMGMIALVRQTFYDAQHQMQVLNLYNQSPNKPRPALNRAYEALQPVLEGKIPLVVTVNDSQDILRVLKLADEFKLNVILAGGTGAAKVADVLKKRNIPILLSIHIPEPIRNYDPDSPPSLTTLRDGAFAAQNAVLLHKAGVSFAITTDGLRTPGDLLGNVRTLITNGLPKEAALESLTIVPARLLGVEKKLGTIEVGKAAHLVLAEGDLFEKDAKVRYVFVDGKRLDADSSPTVAEAGAGRPGGPGGRRFQRPPQDDGHDHDQGGVPTRFDSERPPADEAPQQPETAQPPGRPGRQERNEDKPKPAKPVSLEPLAPKPADEHDTWLIRNATVWTLTANGTMQNADVLVENGKIKAVGKSLQAPRDARIIEANGKHLTPGIIDCHSHTAIAGGVNEGTNVCTAEVRIQDVIDAEDINIYRQLAGGVTAANLLHGSANVIGGQNAVIKFRWGKRADDLLFKEAPPGIKFALGENVKRSGGSEFGGGGNPRYPATRMGVEQVIRERFQSALDYKKQREEFKAGRRPYPPARDLQLDALLEILEGKRLIHCHSYRQDEILMLIRVCEEFGVKIATFQHVLEGYKVADELARHGAGGSTFSDWWAYKIEAYEAIPYNGALMSGRGVVVSFNSDSDEMARRLNMEAAKAVKYGGMAPEEALKLVTLNPAKQLHVDQYVGSIEPGKQADLALWSDDPLSPYVTCEKTFVDGVLYFDRQRDLEFRLQIEKEKNEYLADLKKSSFFEEKKEEPAAEGREPKPEGEAVKLGGVWKGKLTGGEPLPPEGVEFTLTLKTDQNDRVTGTMDTPMGAVDVSGKFDPASGELSFSFTIPGGPTGSVTAKVTGGSMSGSVSVLGQTFEMSASQTSVDPNKGATGTIGTSDAQDREWRSGKVEQDQEPRDKAQGVEVASSRSETGTPLTPHHSPPVSLFPDYSASHERPVTTKGVYAVTNVTIHPITAPVIEKGTVVMRDGKIEAVGANVQAPVGAQVIDGSGRHLYPGLIDPNTTLGLTEIGSVSETVDTREMGPFNPNSRTEIALNPDSELIPVNRANGITTAVAAPDGGTISGMGCVINLDGWTWEDLCIKSPIGVYVSIPSPSNDPARAGDQRKREWEDSMKPLNDFLDNVHRYQRARDASGKDGIPIHERDVRFEAMIPVLEGKLPFFVRVNSALGIKAAIQWAEKQKVKIVIVGGSEAWKVASLLKEKNVPVILGRTHSLPPGDDYPYDHTFSIPKRLYEAGVLFCMSSNDASNVRNLPYNVATAVAFGLPQEKALEVVTINAARILGVDHRLGSIEPGKDANLILTSGDPLDMRTQVQQVFIAGRPVDMSNKHSRLYDKYKARPKK